MLLYYSFTSCTCQVYNADDNYVYNVSFFCVHLHLLCNETLHVVCYVFNGLYAILNK